MSKTRKGAPEKKLPRIPKKDHETKSEIKYKGLKGYYNEEESDEDPW